MKQSGFLSLGWRDFLRGLAMAVLTPVVTLITNSVERGELTFNWRLIILSAIGGAGAYLLKNVFTKPDNPELFADDGEEEPIRGGGTKND